MVSVLIIGAGPSYKNKLELARNFEGIIITHTAFAEIVLDEGITPDYITQYETGKGLNLDHYPPELAETNIPIVYAFDSHSPFRKHLSTYHFKSIEFHSNYHHNINNVGLFGAYFAYEILHADKIYLIGFDHDGHNYYPKQYARWVNNFKAFLTHCPCEVINCSGQGNLYMEGITDGSRLTSF